MIAPAKDVEILQSRPLGKEPSGITRVLGRMFAPLVRAVRVRRRATAEARLRFLVEGAQRCEARDDLERVMGAPVHVLSGAGYKVAGHDGEAFAPDRVECYEAEGCSVELLFRDGGLGGILGYVPWSDWDAVSGLAEATVKSICPAGGRAGDARGHENGDGGGRGTSISWPQA